MRRVRALLVFLVGALCTLFSARARAERVLLVRPTAPDAVLAEAFNRLRAELTLQGFETRVVELDPSASSPEALTELAQKQGAFAGISLTRRVGTPAAEVCIADRVTGKATLRTLALRNSVDAPSVLAIRAADLLRASLREFSPSERPPPEVVGVERGPAPALVRRFAERPPSRFRLSARVAALGVTQAFGPGYGPSLAFDARLVERFGVGLALTGPALGAAFDSANGSAALRQELGVARVWFALAESGGFELETALAAGVYRLDAQGEVTSPLLAKSAHVTSFAGGLALDATYRLTGALVLSGELSAFGLTPRPIVAVDAARSAMTFPFVSASAGVGVEF
ncbi:MAG TPA: hypothetical protein VGM29_17270 [Polyangiaceae bacterium]|jgi:hypothetical protein